MASKIALELLSLTKQKQGVEEGISLANKISLDKLLRSQDITESGIKQLIMLNTNLQPIIEAYFKK